MGVWPSQIHLFEAQLPYSIKWRKSYLYPRIWVCLFGVVVMVVGVVGIYQTHIVSLNLPSYPKRKIIPFPSFSA